MKIITIVGARPQFVKAASLSRAFRQQKHVEERLIHTGQHYDRQMSDLFFEELPLPTPHYTFGIGGVSHGAMTGQMLEKIEEVLLEERPDCVVVFGDTNSTLAGALAAAKLHIHVAHIEAGLRSFNKKMPEEINRVMTDHCSSFLFAPTTQAVTNLTHEKFPLSKIHQVGDVMLDVALLMGDIASQKSQILKTLKISPKKYILATVHRAENTDDPVRLAAIVEALVAIAKDIPVIFPLHPRTRQRLNHLPSAIHWIDPVGYLDMLELERNARLIATDSGGVQKEAFFFKVPCLTLRDETEWTELVEGGYNLLVGAKREAILNGFQEIFHSTPAWSVPLYGNGNAAVAIAQIIAETNTSRDSKIGIWAEAKAPAVDIS